MLNWIFFLSAAFAIPAPCEIRPPVRIGWVWPDGIQSGKHPQPYCPREGDIFLFSTLEPTYLVTYAIARTGHPYHSAIVIRLRDGRLALLESGGGEVLAVNIRLLEERLPAHFTQFPDRKPIAWVRRIRTPLTPAQSEALTQFAELEYGKPFSSQARLLQQWLPTRLIPRTGANPKQWFCSEIVTSSLSRIGMLPADAPNPVTIRPRDIFFDQRLDFSPNWGPPIRWSITRKAPPPGPALAPR